MTAKKVLFIQHAPGLGGSCVSLLKTIRAMDRKRYEPVLALAAPTREVVAYYRDAGVPPIRIAGVPLLNHSTVVSRALWRPDTWREFAVALRRTPWLGRQVDDLLAAVEPDLVHLNSAPLVLLGWALAQKGVPVVQHVREPPPAEGKGSLRTHWYRSLMRSSSSALIFIAKADRASWGCEDVGDVVYNFVDFRRFDRESVSGDAVRRELGLGGDLPVVLFLGGLRDVKGIQVLLEALAIARRSIPRIKCILPGAVVEEGDSLELKVARWVLPRLGSGTSIQRARQAMAYQGLEDVCISLPFRKDIPELLAASRVVVFPALRPHFARPVIEAAAMGKPAIASDFPVSREILVGGETGVLVPPGDAGGVARALVELLRRPDVAKRMGDTGYDMARRRFDLRDRGREIMAIYDRVLGG